MTEERAAAGADMELVRAAAEGDSGAFELLVRRYAGQVYRIALRVCGNPADAEDVAQEVFLKLCRSLNRFQGESSFHTFLYRVTTNAALDFLRGRKRRETVPLEAEGNGPIRMRRRRNSSSAESFSGRCAGGLRNFPQGSGQRLRCGSSRGSATRRSRRCSASQRER